ncbi:ATP-binding protein [Dactylosporangium sp. CS-047395]|uniref:ATP-binding protein n=1 Tax=Dactylosporangium sp. CS-047395 TaxID=3239936 RepID=UPI003D93D348
MTVSLPQQPASIAEARHVLAVLLSLTSTDEQVRDRLATALTEACANAVAHGEPGTTIDLSIAVDAGMCVLEVGNRGHLLEDGLLASAMPAPDQTFGRGLGLISALTDTAAFLPAAAGYVLLRMTTCLHDGAGSPARYGATPLS